MDFHRFFGLTYRGFAAFEVTYDEATYDGARLILTSRLPKQRNGEIHAEFVSDMVSTTRPALMIVDRNIPHPDIFMGIARARSHKVEYVNPIVWKRADEMMKATKPQVVKHARAAFPNHGRDIHSVDIAEAVLMARQYLRDHLHLENSENFHDVNN